MKKTGVTNLPLHYGKAPAWLFQRMVKLAREITVIIVEEFGTLEFLKKISDPFWFQSFGCVLGFDWHSSGVTTTVCGALKEGLKNIDKSIGLYVAGGKGATSRKTPDEIMMKGKDIIEAPEKLVYTSKIVAKVDNTAIQDGFQLYQHNFIFNREGEWVVIQQGMNPTTRYARRYHWLSTEVNEFTNEPHKAICCDIKENKVLNMVAQESKNSRREVVEITKQHPDKLIKEVKKIESLTLPSRHYVDINDIDSKRFYKILINTYEQQPNNFEKLLIVKGLGPKSLRALALIAELIYGDKPSYKDPVRYSFAHGGKDGYPYPVNREIYDKSIETLEKAIKRMKAEPNEKEKALKRLFRFYELS